MNRDPTGYDCTRDPIYLGQIRQLNLVALPYWCEHSDDGDGYIFVNDLDGAPDEVIAKLDPECCISRESLTMILFERGTEDEDGLSCVLESWRTEHVFLTRAEGEAWMKARAYRWNYGYQVYCVCAAGELARLLNELPEPAKEHA